MNPIARARRRRWIAVQVVLIVAWWLLLAPPALGGWTSYISVTGQSMEPTYETGDLVVVRQQRSYDVGDIVAFRTDGGVVIHRIVSADGTGGYELKGDNNDWIDQWRPSDGDVVGKAVVRLPGVARHLLRLLDPRVLSAAVVMALVVTFASRPSTASPINRQVTTRKTGTMNLADLRRTAAAIPARTLTAIAVTASVGTATVAASGLAWFDDAQRTTFREDATYTQRADLAYTFQVDRGTLYPDGVVGPIDAAAEDQPPVFALPARRLDVTVDYQIEGDAADIAGAYTVDAVITAESGWQTTMPLIEETSFTGPSASIDIAVALDEVTALLDRIDIESGTTASSYTLSIRPTIDVDGRVDGEPVTESMEPTLDMTFDREVWDVTSPLELDTPVVLGADVTEDVTLLGVPVSLLRWAFVPGVLLWTIAAELSRRGVRRSPAAAVSTAFARPGIAVIDVDQRPSDERRSLLVHSPDDLRRVAERDGGLVLRHAKGATVSYFVHHDAALYRYDFVEARR
jgi:signal peptidase